jgi:hypothetical protein
MFLAIIANLAWAQGAGSAHGNSPTEVVDELWKIATQGDLLTVEGWQRARVFIGIRSLHLITGLSM